MINNLKQKNIPNGWGQIPLEKIILENKKSDLKAGDADNIGEKPFFTSGEKKSSHSFSIVDGENIFMGTGGTANIKYFDGNASYSTDTYSFKSKEDTKFLYYFLLNKIKYINIRHFSGSGLKHLQKNDFKKESILLPLIKEQKKIAEILEAVDSEIEKTDEIIAATEKLKKGLMQQLFSVKGKMRKLKDIAKLITKGTTPTTYGHPFTNEGINFFKIENIDDAGYINLQTCKHISEKTYDFLKRSQLVEGDVLFSIAGALGRVAVVDSAHLPANTNQAIAIIRLKDKSNSIFVSQVMRTDHVKRQVIGSSVQLAQANISLGKLGEISIPWPEVKERTHISNIIQAVEQKVSINQKLKEKFITLKKGLMQDLLSGKIRTI